MKGLILKDIYLNKKGLIIALIVVAVYSLLLTRSVGVTFIIFFSTVMFAALPVKSLAFDESSHWNRLALSMPLRRQEIVKAKFVSAILFCTLGTLFGLVLALIYTAFGGVDVGYEEPSIAHVFEVAVIAWSYTIMSESIGIAAVYKFGAPYNWILFPVCFVSAGAVVVGFYLLGDWLGLSVSYYTLLTVLMPVLALVVMYLFYKISCKIYSKQDF